MTNHNLRNRTVLVGLASGLLLGTGCSGGRQPTEPGDGGSTAGLVPVDCAVLSPAEVRSRTNLIDPRGDSGVCPTPTQPPGENPPRPESPPPGGRDPETITPPTTFAI